MDKIKDFNLKNFISSTDLNNDQIYTILELASGFKAKISSFELDRKVLGLVFDKASTRTRVSFQVAMSNLGGTTIDLNPQTSQIGRGEPIKDTARVLSRYCDLIAVRTFRHDDLKEYAKWSTKPIINALTDLEHPCQILADLLTIKEEFKTFDDVVLTFIGDGNNVANSLILASAILDIEIRIACPKGFEPNSNILKEANNLSSKKITITDNVKLAVKEANVLYTDVWSSMGQENEKDSKDKNFKGFTLDSDLLNLSSKNSIVLHCLPAYRDKEITDEVIDSNQSRVFNQAENRVYVQQALIYAFLSN